MHQPPTLPMFRGRVVPLGLGTAAGLCLVLAIGELYFRARLPTPIPPVEEEHIQGGGDERYHAIGRVIEKSSVPGVYYQLKPNCDSDCWLARLRTNSLGMRRDTEVSVTKPADAFRVACLGDSCTFGFGLEVDSTWPALLEHKLNEVLAPTMTAEVHNWGVPGYNTAQEVATYLYKAAPFGYDLVLLGMVWGDDQPPSTERWYNKKGIQSAFLDYLIVNFRDGMGCLKRSLQELKAETADRGAPVVVVLIDSELALGEGCGVAFLESMKPFISSLGFGLVDMCPVYERYLNEAGKVDSTCLWVRPNPPMEDPHPNRLACRLIAEAVCDYLHERVPPFNRTSAAAERAPLWPPPTGSRQLRR